MDELLPLLAFAVVTTGTPGPNNVLLWASGAAFGARATLRHVVGTAIGVGGIVFAVAIGLGAVVTAVPVIGLAMKVIGSAYLLYLAFAIARSASIEQGTAAKPLGVLAAVAFQAVNPKVWVFALAVGTAFRPADMPVAAGSLFVALVVAVVAGPTAAVWAVAGGVVGRLLTGDRSARVLRVALGVVVAATVIGVWV
ncbi:MAG TPA: LysE family translocator [candidate division Zixibacteria bacterium]|nr:LysE family translocator [candidate division Zixibacteria bacterium]